MDGGAGSCLGWVALNVASPILSLLMVASYSRTFVLQSLLFLKPFQGTMKSSVGMYEVYAV